MFGNGCWFSAGSAYMRANGQVEHNFDMRKVTIHVVEALLRDGCCVYHYLCLGPKQGASVTLIKMVPVLN